VKLTTKSEYSILALIHLARQEKKGYIKIDEICDRYSIPQKYLEQLFTSMKNSHFINSKRGKEGGYRLAVPAENIKIADVVRLMDGALAPVESASKYFYSHSPIEQEKKILAVFREIRDFVSNKLEALKLSQLV